MSKSGWVDLKILYAAKPSLTNYIWYIFLIILLDLKCGIQRLWWLKIEQVHIDQRFDNKKEWKCQFRKTIIEDFSGNELALGLEKLTQSVILEKVLFSFITTMNCSKSYSGVKWLGGHHFWNTLEQFCLKILLHTFKYVLQSIFTAFYWSADTRNFSQKYL